MGKILSFVYAVHNVPHDKELYFGTSNSEPSKEIVCVLKKKSGVCLLDEKVLPLFCLSYFMICFFRFTESNAFPCVLHKLTIGLSAYIFINFVIVPSLIQNI